MRGPIVPVAKLEADGAPDALHLRFDAGDLLVVPQVVADPLGTGAAVCAAGVQDGIEGMVTVVLTRRM